MIHEPLTADPDILQALEDFRQHGADLRRHSFAALSARNPREREHHESAARTLMDDITLRCERLECSPAGLVELINVDLDRRARRGRQDPKGESSRTLLTKLGNACALEDEAERALLAAQLAYGTARAARIAAEDAYQVYSAGRDAA